MADETLAARNSTAPRLLYDKGAIAQKDLEVAAGRGRARPRSPSKPREEHLRVLGADLDHPTVR